jgi:hypothetical protein
MCLYSKNQKIKQFFEEKKKIDELSGKDLFEIWNNSQNGEDIKE